MGFWRCARSEVVDAGTKMQQVYERGEMLTTRNGDLLSSSIGTLGSTLLTQTALLHSSEASGQCCRIVEFEALSP